MFKIFTDRYIKTCRSLKRRAILKIPYTVFQNLCSFRWLENETSTEKRFPVLRQKLIQILPWTCWKKQPSIFTVYLMNHIFQTSVLIMECIELNWLRKHMKKIRSSKPAIPVLNWVKHKPFPLSIVNLWDIFRFIFFRQLRMTFFPKIMVAEKNYFSSNA